jgi:hypothetical protein
MKPNSILLLLLLLLFAVLPMFVFSQQASPHKDVTSSQFEQSGNIERYKLDYELINYVFINGDSTILNALNIDGMLLSRKTNVDVELTNLEYGVRILIYSESRSKLERNVKRTKPSTHKYIGE